MYVALIRNFQRASYKLYYRAVQVKLIHLQVSVEVKENSPIETIRKLDLRRSVTKKDKWISQLTVRKLADSSIGKTPRKALRNKCCRVNA